MADAVDTFKELEQELIAFENFITQPPTGPAIILAVQSLRGLHVPIDVLLDLLISLMTQLQTAITSINFGTLNDHLPNIAALATHVNNLMLAAKVLLPPAQGTEIQKAIDAANALNALGSLAGAVQDSILLHLGIIIARLQVIRAS
jgi:hypothetical protein